MFMVGKGRYFWMVGSVVVSKDETAIGALVVVFVIYPSNPPFLYQRDFFYEF